MNHCSPKTLSQGLLTNNIVHRSWANFTDGPVEQENLHLPRDVVQTCWWRTSSKAFFNFWKVIFMRSLRCTSREQPNTPNLSWLTTVDYKEGLGFNGWKIPGIFLNHLVKHKIKQKMGGKRGTDPHRPAPSLPGLTQGDQDVCRESHIWSDAVGQRGASLQRSQSFWCLGVLTQ